MKLYWQELRRALHWHEIQWRSLAWLVAGLVVLALWLVLWLGQALAHHRSPVMAQDAETEAAVESRDWAKAVSATLGAMVHEVPPLDLSQDQVAKASQHAPEFRGADFVKAQAHSWTVQLMTVTEESVIRDYLSRRKDRSQFYYFRTLSNRNESYVLVYGIFNTVQTALGAVEVQAFELPGSVRPTPVRFSSFLNLVAPDQASNVSVTGLNKTVRQVKLRTVAVPADNPLDRPALDESAEDRPRPRATPAESIDSGGLDRLGELADQAGGRTIASGEGRAVQDGFEDAPEAPPSEETPLPSGLSSGEDPFATTP